MNALNRLLVTRGARGERVVLCVVPRLPSDEHVEARCGELVPDETLVLDAELPAGEGLRLLEQEGLTWAPVVDDNGTLLGLVRVSQIAGLPKDSDAEVEDVVSPTEAARDDLTVPELARLMTDAGLAAVPVTDCEGRLLGVVTAVDVMRWLLCRH